MQVLQSSTALVEMLTLVEVWRRGRPVSLATLQVMGRGLDPGVAGVSRDNVAAKKNWCSGSSFMSCQVRDVGHRPEVLRLYAAMPAVPNALHECAEEFRLLSARSRATIARQMKHFSLRCCVTGWIAC